MGNALGKKLESAKKHAVRTFRFYPKNDKEVIGDDSSVNEVVDVIDDDDYHDDVEIVEKEESQHDEKVLDLTSDEDHDDLWNRDVEEYRKLNEIVERERGRFSTREFEERLNWRKGSSFESLRALTKPEEEDDVQEIPLEPFISLTAKEVAEVTRAFSVNNRRRVLVTHDNSNIDITGELLRCLMPHAWLNDEVINVYLALLKEREKREPNKFLKCHFFNTFFYKKLTSGWKDVYDYKAVKRWTTERKLGYFLVECDKIFVPIHREIHWCLAVINKRDRKFQYLDSLGGKDFTVLENLARYYVDEVKDKNKKDIDVNDWGWEFVEQFPKQQNGYDCGVFMIKYADFYSRGLRLCFGQEQMPYFRLRTAKEILRLRAD